MLQICKIVPRGNVERETEMAHNLDWVISVDDDIIEPDHIWTDRMPAKFKDEAPRVVVSKSGTEAWLFGGKRRSVFGMTVAAGKGTDEFSADPLPYSEMRESCFDSKARLRDMDRDNTLATGTFPSFPGLCGQTFSEHPDREVALASIQAYNDFVLEEWCGADKGRFIAMIIVPLWDPLLAVEEAKRCKLKGAHAICFPERPASIGDGAGGRLPSLHDVNGYWEPLFRFAAEANMPLTIHIGASGDIDTTSPDAPIHVVSTIIRFISPQKVALDWLYSGWFLRIPNLKVCLSEGGVGWIPPLLDMCDYHWEVSYGWVKKAGAIQFNADFNIDQIAGPATDRTFVPLSLDEQMSRDIKPSELFRRNMFGCFLQDSFGERTVKAVGADNIMLESDFPHSDSKWPNTVRFAKDSLRNCTDEEKYKVFRGTAMRVFDFEPASIEHAEQHKAMSQVYAA
jgi:predicted TIM-barrel fold metal-dependent hydrolase